MELSTKNYQDAANAAVRTKQEQVIAVVNRKVVIHPKWSYKGEYLAETSTKADAVKVVDQKGKEMYKVDRKKQKKDEKNTAKPETKKEPSKVPADNRSEADKSL